MAMLVLFGMLLVCMAVFCGTLLLFLFDSVVLASSLSAASLIRDFNATVFSIAGVMPAVGTWAHGHMR